MPARHARPGGAPPTALLVDDEDCARNLARLVLLTEGPGVFDAPDAEGALLVAAAHPATSGCW